MTRIIGPLILVPLLILALLIVPAIQAAPPATQPATQPTIEFQTPARTNDMPEKIVKSEEEWRKELTPAEFKVLREKGTDRAFSGKLYRLKDTGTYKCAGCGLELFDSETKYESGSGWPSFYAPLKESAVETHEDRSHGMVRTEVTCARCGGHLGHIFEDGPEPTGLRYCINSSALDFEKKRD